MNEVMYSSKTAEWSTPQNLFNQLNSEFQFTLDPCATPQNAKCAKFYTPEEDGLSMDWSGERVFMNPPYGREISKWVQKAYEGGGRNNCLPTTRPNRYEVVARILYQGRSEVHKRPPKVRGFQKFRALPQRHSHI